MAKLQSQGKNVFLVSGGFRQVIHPIAESLNIPVSNVFANNLLFQVRAALVMGEINSALDSVSLTQSLREGLVKRDRIRAPPGGPCL